MQVAAPIGRRLILFGQAKRGEITLSEARKVSSSLHERAVYPYRSGSNTFRLHLVDA